MDPERPHRSTNSNNTTTSSTSELFICFTSQSRLSSSSSMKIPSKSILTPGSSREPCSQISLSSSLSRRLRSNGSMKGGQASPMFPITSNGKKRGGGFENPEPSSPKVTCIGQVRVKTKKQGRKFRACRSKRRDVSFRRVDRGNGVESSSSQDYNVGHFLSSNNSLHHQQQQQQQECRKWVHLPLTICEALRGFGSEFNCFLPCRSSCMANQRDNNKQGKTRGSGNGNGRSSSSCGAVFTRWLVAVQEGEGKERGIELVVGGEDDERGIELVVGGEDDERRMRSSQRRHVFEDIEINDFVNEEEEEGRASICIPPKNALLLMRCRSDPVKMAALANKFWETPVPKPDYDDEEEESEEKVETEMEHEEASEVTEMLVSCEANEEQEIPEAESVLVKDGSPELVEETSVECQDQEHENEMEETQQESTFKEQNLTEVSLDIEKLPVEEDESAIEELQQAETEAEAEEEEEEREDQNEAEEEGLSSTMEEEESERSEPESPENESKESESEEKLLPDCLLLMMCEPKLSMEVSKETWVCSTDFIRWLPEKRKQPLVKQKDGGDEPKRRTSVDSNPRPIFLHPPRSSCSFPAAPPMDTAVAAATNGVGGGGSTKEHTVVGGKGYEPFALTRCKSEPRRPAAKLAPDACFWKNRKLEPTSVGVGAAGVGF
ncbi:hypothetical protein HRI_002203200 [Hibiscus trionum]|uniref:Uncharacterized protein n=1 Tax=Hibiscus trionum TaxID=183268 RepID=A0A9W7M283_HIBTR|nr:hypothetical protein HRI_002203200 [Hibiscus trionum]